MTANATGNKTNESTGVALLFKHQLSQVEIKAKNGNEGYVYKVTGVRIGQPVSKGTFDFGTSGWTLTQDKTNYLAEYDQAITLGADAQGLMGDGGNAMLLPQQLVAWTPDTDMPNANKGAYLAVKVNITTKDGARVYPAESVGEYDVTRNFAASLFRNIKYFTLRKLYLCRKWMQKRLQKTTTTGITLPNFDFLA